MVGCPDFLMKNPDFLLRNENSITKKPLVGAVPPELLLFIGAGFKTATVCRLAGVFLRSLSRCEVCMRPVPGYTIYWIYAPVHRSARATWCGRCANDVSLSGSQRRWEGAGGDDGGRR